MASAGSGTARPDLVAGPLGGAFERIGGTPLVWRLASLALFFGIWELAARTGFNYAFPSFLETMSALWESGAKVAVATHDDALVEKALALIRERGLGPERYEFQLLLGVREELADELVAGGHTVRIYVPYGQKWYEYSLRRLQENPKLAGYAARDLLQRLRP